MAPKINSRAKGARFERWTCDLFKKHTGERARRTSDGYNQAQRGDIVHPLLERTKIHIENKHVETIALESWLKQADDDSVDTGKLPALIWRTNRVGPFVTLRPDVFMELLRRYEKSLQHLEDPAAA